MRHAREQLARETRNLVDDAGELALTQHDEVHVGLGNDGRVAGRLLEQCELAERGARTDRRDLAAVAEDPGGSAEDDEELVTGLALGHERLVRADVDLLGPLGDQLEVLAGAGREQRDLLEVIDEDVVPSHGPGI